MDEALYRLQQTVLRMFGPSARIAGTGGSGRGPGSVRIVLDGRTLGTGRTFEQAMQDVSRQQREVVRCSC